MCQYQITKYFGRTGNNLLHILSVLFHVEEDQVGKCLISPHRLFKFKSTTLRGCICDNVKTFNDQILLSLSLHRLKELYEKYLQTTMKPVTQTYDIGIHIRSGDIFQGKGHGLYVQPPLYFYEKIINENPEKTKVIVFENINNPVIVVLMQQYKNDPNIVFQSNTLEADIMTLSQCRTMVCSVGTFCLVSFVISTSIEKLVIPDYFVKNQWFTFDNVATEIIELPGYYTGKWANTKEQNEKIITYNDALIKT